MQFRKDAVPLAAAAALLAATSGSVRAAATTQVIPIVNDTFVDSGAPAAPMNGVDEVSYGADGSVKVVVANTTNSMSVTTASVTHVLFQIPSTVFADHAAGLASDVTVNYYPKNDSLAGAGTDNNVDGDSVILLHPLTRAFTVGDGTQTPFVPSTTGGATYLTSDGSTPWTTPGGDFDPAYVTDTNGTLPASKGTVPFTWDITSLLANPTTAAELSADGAILVLPDTIAQVPAGTQDFTSLYSANNTAGTPFVSVTLVPEPAAAGMVTAAAAAALARRRRGSRTEGK